jgi:hypothetical protein
VGARKVQRKAAKAFKSTIETRRRRRATTRRSSERVNAARVTSRWKMGSVVNRFKEECARVKTLSVVNRLKES